nr:PIN domain-containing protein [uncultured Treponema sp.]
MILLDTNVVIDMINNSQDAHWELLNKEDVVVCGIVIAELYRGIKNAAEKNAVELFVNAVDELPLDSDASGEDWKKIGMFIADLRKSGLSVPFQDAVIAYLAIKYKTTLCSNDRHFKLIQTVNEKLQLAQ